MKTLLVLAQHPELAESIRAALDPDQYRVIHRLDVEEAEPLLSHGMLDACAVDVEMMNVQGLWVIEKLRRRFPNYPLLVYTGSNQWEWEEEAYLQGAAHVLAKPVRGRMLNNLLDRLWPAAARAIMVRPAAPRSLEPLRAAERTSSNAFQTLEVLRDFSVIMTHSLCAEAMLKQFLLLLREIIGVNRAAIFLRQPFALFTSSPTKEESRRMHSSCAIGLAPGLLEHFELDRKSVV